MSRERCGFGVDLLYNKLYKKATKNRSNGVLAIEKCAVSVRHYIFFLGRCSEKTQSDFVEFSNFNVPLTDRKMARLCGEGSYYSVQSDGSFFRVTFTSNDIFDGTGFMGRYEFKVHRQGIQSAVL